MGLNVIQPYLALWLSYMYKKLLSFTATILQTGSRAEWLENYSTIDLIDINRACALSLSFAHLLKVQCLLIFYWPCFSLLHGGLSQSSLSESLAHAVWKDKNEHTMQWVEAYMKLILLELNRELRNFEAQKYLTFAVHFALVALFRSLARIPHSFRTHNLI